MPVAVHLSDSNFTSRCSYEDVYVLPCCSSQASSENSNAKVNKKDIPSAFLACPWLLTPSPSSLLTSSGSSGSSTMSVERAVMGWRCRVCGSIDIEKNQWLSPQHCVSNDAGDQTSQQASRSSKRRAAKDQLRRRMQDVNPLCSQCCLCPRCSHGLQVRFGNDLQGYYLLCGVCQWRSCGQFSDMDALHAYLSSLGIMKAEPLRQWRHAQREANYRLRNFYLNEGGGSSGGDNNNKSNNTTTRHIGQCAPASSTSVSRLAWSKYIALTRPGAGAAGASHDVASKGGAPSTVPLLDLNITTTEHTSREALVMQQAAQPGTHPALALEMLRGFYEETQRESMMRQRCGQKINNSSSSAAINFTESSVMLPSYVIQVDAKCQGLSTDEMDGTCPELMIGKEKKDALLTLSDSAESSWLSVSQQSQFGLHADYTSTCVSGGDTLMHMFRTGGGGGTAVASADATALATSSHYTPSRTMAGGIMLSSRTPAAAAAAAAAGTVGGAAQSARHAQLEGLVLNGANDDFLHTVRPYYIKSVGKDAIDVTIVRTVSSDVTASCTQWILDYDERDDAALAEILESWIQAALTAASSAAITTAPTATLPTTRHPIPVFRKATSTFSAVRVLPFIQVVDACEDRLALRMINLGAHDIIITRMGIAKARGVYAMKLLHPAPHGGEDTTVMTTTLGDEDDESQWVRLSPRSSAEEMAAAAGVVLHTSSAAPSKDFASASTTTTNTTSMGTRATTVVQEVLFEVSWTPAAAPAGDDKSVVESRFVGLQLCALTMLDGEAALMQALSGGGGTDSLAAYHRVEFGISLVW